MAKIDEIINKAIDTATLREASVTIRKPPGRKDIKKKMIQLPIDHRAEDKAVISRNML